MKMSCSNPGTNAMTLSCRAGLDEARPAPRGSGGGPEGSAAKVMRRGTGRRSRRLGPVGNGRAAHGSGWSAGLRTRTTTLENDPSGMKNGHAPSIPRHLRARLVVFGRGARLVEADADDFGAGEEVPAPGRVAAAGADGVNVDAVGGGPRVRLRLHAHVEDVAAGGGRVAAHLGLKDARVDELPERAVLAVGLEVELLGGLYVFEVGERGRLVGRDDAPLDGVVPHPQREPAQRDEDEQSAARDDERGAPQAFRFGDFGLLSGLPGV